PAPCASPAGADTEIRANAVLVLQHLVQRMPEIEAVAVALEHLPVQTKANAADACRAREVAPHLAMIEKHIDIMCLPIRPVQFNAAEVALDPRQRTTHITAHAANATYLEQVAGRQELTRGELPAQLRAIQEAAAADAL